MEKNFLNIIDALNENDLELVKSRENYLKHIKKIKLIFEINCLETLHEKQSKEFFFKAYTRDDFYNHWGFYDYGYLRDNKFITYKSKLLFFDIPDIEKKIFLKEDSNHHLIVLDKDYQYLLYNPNLEIINAVIDKYLLCKK